MHSNRIYLDYNSTAPILPDVKKSIVDTISIVCGNASSVHNEGRLARSIIESSRNIIAEIFNCSNEGIIFTSGGTEANNLALLGHDIDDLIISAQEHACILACAGVLASKGVRVHHISVTNNGELNLSHFEEILSCVNGKSLVSVMVANNETGVIHQIREISDIARKYNALIHSDGVQAAGKIEIDFSKLNVDMLSISAHKIGGPQGIGALLCRPCINLKPHINGGGQELGFRSGTENLLGIVGFAAAAKNIYNSIAKNTELLKYRELLESSLQEITPKIRIFSQDQQRLPNTSCFAIPNIDAETLLMNFDIEGFAIGSGSACSSGKIGRSHVLRAMEVSNELIMGALRLSMGWQTTEDEIKNFIASWAEICKRLNYNRLK